MKPVTYKGVTYESIMACATHFGISPYMVKDRLKKGHPLEVRNIHQANSEAARIAEAAMEAKPAK